MKKFFKAISEKLRILKNKKLGSLNYVLIILGVLLIFMISLMFGYGLSTKSLIVASSKQLNESYYLLEAGKFDEYNEAQETACKIQTQGGAGYIFYDAGFRVFWAGYVNKLDAERVRDNNSSLNLSIYELTIKNIDFTSDFSQNINQMFKSNLICFKSCIGALDNLVVKYEKGEETISYVKNNCLILTEEAEQQYEKLNDNFYQDATMYKLRSYYKEFVTNIKEITNINLEGVDFSKTLRFKEISCMFCLKKIADTI